LYFLVYVSAAVTWFSPSELRALLDSSRASNERAGITGMLLYKDGNFMQALEGEEAAVCGLKARIELDRRHQGMVTICSGHAEDRQFAQWSMAFVDLDAMAGEPPAGYSRFMDLPLTDPSFAQAPSRCHELLNLFRQID
jgi:Sensors of blue-light using FAD